MAVPFVDLSLSFFISEALGLYVPIPIDDFLEFLFGSHAGSCGVFREAAQDFDRETQDLNHQFSTLAAADIRDPLFQNHNIHMQFFLDGVVALGKEIQGGFDEYKGRNMLGYTMYSSRVLWFILERLLASTIFHNGDFAQAVRDTLWLAIDNHTQRLQVLESQSRTTQSQLANFQLQLNDIKNANNQQWNAIQQLEFQITNGLIALEQELRAAIGTGDVNLQQNLNKQFNELANDLLELEREINVLLNDLTQAFDAQLSHERQQRMNADAELRSDLTALITLSVQNLQANMNRLRLDLIAAINAGDAKLAADLHNQVVRLEFIITTNVQNLQQNIDRVRADLTRAIQEGDQNVIIQFRRELETLESELTTTLNQTKQELLNRIAQLRTEMIAADMALQANLNKLRDFTESEVKELEELVGNLDDRHARDIADLKRRMDEMEIRHGEDIQRLQTLLELTRDQLREEITISEIEACSCALQTVGRVLPRLLSKGSRDGIDCLTAPPQDEKDKTLEKCADAKKVKNAVKPLAGNYAIPLVPAVPRKKGNKESE